MRTILRRFTFLKEREEIVRRASSGLKGWIIDRSSGRSEDSFTQNLAGLFISPNKKDARLALQGVKEIFKQAMETVWLAQNSLLSKEEGFAILMQPFLSFDASGTAMSHLYGHTTVEAVVGNAQMAVRSMYANAAQYDFEKGTLQYAPSFLKSPYLFRLKGKEYCAVTNPEEMEQVTKRYPRINGLFSPISAEQAGELNRVVLALEERIGVPLDVEWGTLDGKLYITQIRPIIGDFKKPLVEMDAGLKECAAIAQTPIALGHTESKGFTGKMVLFGRNVQPETIKQFEHHHYQPYIRVQSDVATAVLHGTTRAKVLVDPDQGSRQAHNVNAITGRISNKEFVYANGPVLKEGLNKLRFIPHERMQDVWVSEQDVTYFSDGLTGRFYVHKDVGFSGWKQLASTRQLGLDKIHLALLSENLDIKAYLSGSNRAWIHDALSNPLYPRDWENQRIAEVKIALTNMDAAERENADAAKHTKSKAFGEMPRHPGKFQLLILDADEPFTHATSLLLKSKLSDVDYEITSVSNSAQATVELSSKKYDLAVCDAAMADRQKILDGLHGVKHIIFLTTIAANDLARAVGEELAARSTHIEKGSRGMFTGVISMVKDLRRIQMEAYESARERWDDLQTRDAVEPKLPELFHILVVDDTSVFLTSMQFCLSSDLSYDEYYVSFADSVNVALRIMDSKKADLVFFDASLANMGVLLDRLNEVKHLVLLTGMEAETARKVVGESVFQRCTFMQKSKDNEYSIPVKLAREAQIAAYERAHSAWEATHPIHVSKAMEKHAGTIFIVNDSSAEAKDLSNLVTEETKGDYKVITTVTLSALKRALKKDKPDIVIADMFMDQKDVIDEIITIAKERNPNVKIIITSEEAAITPMGRFDGSNVVGMVEKPFYFQGAMAHLRTLLDSVHLLMPRPLDFAKYEDLFIASL